ncbi:peptidoglycan-binding protein [Ornithinibacillus halotolerans]|uniref:LysM domain-containing protein n=1 Tax=Ornithinibacillus halotolerans TaxID=1274357 RepID=A0A916W473_9BACI|nr:peptidoglycan-binding protein [Ornithinibacillus halotolerans]GGA64871.1 hypothetical protein GCM10008025_05840 [Ornithinibacillus halotolerans]
MSLFINHSVETNNDELIVTLYLDKRFGHEEFSKEFFSKGNKKSLESEVKNYFKTHLPNIKSGIVKIAFGTMILTVLPIQTFAQDLATDPSGENIEYVIQAEDTVPLDDTTTTQTDDGNENIQEPVPEPEPSTEDDTVEPVPEPEPPTIDDTEEPVPSPDTDEPSDTTQDTPQETTYIVMAGDTLTRISNQHHVTIDEIKEANNLTSDVIYVGQQLIIPNTDTTESDLVEGEQANPEPTDTVQEPEAPELENEPIQFGMHRDDVVILKENLDTLGFVEWKNPPTDYFGRSSEQALLDFQAFYGLNETGVADQDTLAKIDNILSSPLQDGNRHDDAIQLKINLEILGYVSWKNPPNNFFGSSTKEAVQRFQQDNNLPVSGIADQLTFSKLQELAQQPLHVGMNRPDAVDMKKNLEILGYVKWKNEPTGYYGSQTKAAVISFQSDYGLPATGVVDSVTMSTLEDAANAPMREGMYRSDAIDLKINLEQLGFISWKNTPNNFFGPSSANALQNFQSYYGLEATGIADQATLQKIDDILASPLQDGNRHEDAIQLKKDLEKIGIVKWKNSPTNYFGSSTKRAVEDFQRQYNLPVSGIADARTLQKIAEVREAVVEINSFYITGKGYGHAVGMTQYGAYGMAKAGHSYEEIIKYYYTGVELSTRDTENQLVRVLLAQNASTITISSDQPYQVGDKEFPAHTVTSIQYENGEYVIKNSGNTYTRESQLQISSTQGGLLHFKDQQYEGIFYISEDAGKLDLVNHINVESYLKGVVPYEIIPSWNNMDLYKTQTLAARTYVLKEIQRDYDRNFDVYDTVRSQVYHGVPTSIPEVYVNKINQAIAETKGQVIVYNGTLIDAVYSASSGGHTVDAADVWGNSVPYLVGKEDPYDTFVYSNNWWNYTITKQDLEELYPSVGKIIDVRVEETKYNRPTEISIIGEDDSITVTGSEFRSKIGSDKLKSNTFTIEGIS